ARGVTVHPLISRVVHLGNTTAPPTTAECLAAFGARCYGPTQIETAYDEAPLFAHGIDGSGETIVVVDAFGAPDIRTDLAHFDQTYGLATPGLTILPYGTVPAFNPTTGTMAGWAEETTLDVEYSHTTAPGANILLVETATPETLGVTGFPTIVNAETYVVDHHLGDVITQSFGASEQTFESPRTVAPLRTAYLNAQFRGVTVLAASGDTAAAGAKTLTDVSYFPYAVVGWPASDPLVTGVGGTQLNLGTTGAQVAPQDVWNTTTAAGAPEGGGGGYSDVFTRPTYQSSVASTVGYRRGVPDVSMSASCAGFVDVYITGLATGGGWFGICGTSEASPLFSGIVALTDQVAHHPVGFIDPALYEMKAANDPGIVDVTQGNNSTHFTTPTTGQTVDIAGYSASAGYNLATGIGTVDAAQFVPDLAAAARHTPRWTFYLLSPFFLPTP
ncbi:MAG: S53 family peptidase, partial [Acidimicrobiales bacterium]